MYIFLWLAAELFLFFFVVLLGSFIQWDGDVAQWSQNARLGVIWCWVIWSVIFSIYFWVERE